MFKVGDKVRAVNAAQIVTGVDTLIDAPEQIIETNHGGFWIVASHYEHAPAPDDAEPITAEWLETQGWESRMTPGVLFRSPFWWRSDAGIRVGGGIPTTIKTRGDLQTFLKFFGDAT